MEVGYLQKIGISLQSKSPTLQMQKHAVASANGANGVAAPHMNGSSKPQVAPASRNSCMRPCCLLGQGFADKAVERPGRAAWLQPTDGHSVGLKTFNSLTGEKEPFVPLEGKKVRWYTCGPTVYDVAHMGHARAYLTFDILRRIMKDYFEYDVIYQINITDIDDKIILRSRQNKLMSDFRQEVMPQDKKVLEDIVDEAVGMFGKKLAAKKPEEPAATATSKEKAEFIKLTQEHELKMRQHEELKKKVIAAKQVSKEALLETAKDPIMAKLDKERGHTITDHSIFDAHARRFENEYFDDMDNLGILRPDVVTRISDYMDGRVQVFIEKLVDKGYCYASNGSVYFSIDKFNGDGYNYRKLDPVTGDTSAAEMAEGEGALADETAEKKNPNDFAVWKASKPGEPAWESKWGPGRPGWHIECSVMATDVHKEFLDVHGGGEDLKFPHHDNEMAQTEAYLGRPQWVNYFWHAGHLSIEGLKMSKSLKNFITIRQALEMHSARCMRLMFLMQPWDKSMNYSDQAMDMAKAEERRFKHVLGSLQFYLRHPHGLAPDASAVIEMCEKVKKGEEAIGEALRDNFGTSKVIATLSQLSQDCYDVYGKLPNAGLDGVKKACDLVERTLKMLGVEDLVPVPAGGKQAELTKALDAYASLRQEVRTLLKEKKPLTDVTAAAERAAEAAATAKKDGLAECADSFQTFIGDLVKLASSNAPNAEILKRCDQVRDGDFVALGVRLEDKVEGFLWMHDSKEFMERELKEQEEKKIAAAKEKIKNKLETKQKELKAAEKNALEPKNLFRKAEYATFDETGVPLTLASGEEVSAKKKKDFAKDIAKQQKDYDKLLKQSNGDIAAYLEKLRAEVQELEQQLR